MAPLADPYRCERCRVYWAPEAAATALWHHAGFTVCTDRSACDRRLDYAARLDSLIEYRPQGPVEPADRAPVLTLQLPPRQPGERQ